MTEIYMSIVSQEWKVNFRAPSDTGNRLAMEQETGGYEKKAKRLSVLKISVSN